MIEPALVSIGLPVHNEASHVDAALTALRAQDYPRLEIIVCDNASTDATLAICQRHADADPRIRIESAPENIGATANFRRSFDLAQGEFFMWASGHDLWSPGLLTECVALLQDHHDACLAYASCDWIGPDGEPFARESGWYDTRGMVAAARFFTVLWGNMHPVLGVMRSSTLRDCGSVPALIGGDLVLLADLSLRGSFLHAVQSRWSRRELRAETDYRQKLKRYSSESFGITRSRLAKVFPLVKLPLELFKRVWRARIGALDKAVMLAALVPALALRYRVGRRGQSH
jgi:glycosyltransferase involved in cell wall biosynthesis